MSILVLWASPDLDGITANAKDHFAEGIRKAGSEVKEIHLNRQKIDNCLACGKYGFGKCREGVCVLKDDMAEIYQAMCNADAIAFITPVYWHDISENFKALLDRIRRCETSKNGFLSGKRCTIIACAGGTGNGAIQAISNLESILGHMEMKAVERIALTRFNQEYMMPIIELAGENFAKNYETFRFDGYSW